MSNISFERTETEGVWFGQKDTEGPTVAILGGVHGDEQTGIEVVRQSLDTLGLDTGSLILILGNLAAIESDKPRRFIDTNLNRSFRPLSPEEMEIDPVELPYEVRRGQALIPYLRKSEAVLDLHDFTNKCNPFIITERNGLKTALSIGAPLISFGWSETEPGGSDGYMVTHVKTKDGQPAEGLCYELGIKSKPMQNLERGHGAVSRFLIAHELVEGNLEPMYKNPDLVQTRNATTRTGSYEWARNFKNFEHLEPGELIMIHDDQEIRATEGDVIIFPTLKPDIGEEMFTLGFQVNG